MHIEQLSDTYTVRRMTKEDIPAMLRLCRGNPQFYRYCPPAPDEDGLREDLSALPPGKVMQDKYYIGYFDGERLIALMDLIDGYPAADTAFIGFFMVEAALQGAGRGSALIGELTDCLRKWGYRAIRLGWVEGNAQSEGFWHKNGFRETGVRADTGEYTIIVAEKQL